MSTAENQAVFLSYASQDAAAVARIAEALRAAGVEVWFDQNELVGGDAWDAKIRGQIASCALFVPIISAATQARREGYFRLEWKLAAQRTHMMSERTAFLLPVVIDATRDAEADVPGEFRAVQWTRLRGGEGATAEKFCARVKQLLMRGESKGREPIPGALESEGPKTRAVAHLVIRRIPVAGWVGGSAILLLLAAFAMKWTRNEPAVRSPGPGSSAAQQSGAAAPASPLREWVKKARVLYEPWDLATAQDFKQAEELLARALQLDPTDVEALASQALLSCGMYVIPHDLSPERLREARNRAEMAVKLAPKSDYALFAHAYSLRLSAETRDEGIRLLRDLVARNPENKMMIRVLGAPLSRLPETRSEGLALLARAAALPGGEPMSEYVIGETLARYTSRYAEAVSAFDRAIALAPNFADAHKEKIITLLERMGDATGARRALDQVPPVLLRQDRLILVSYKVWMAVNEPNQALRAMAEASPYMTMDVFMGPAGYFRALAHRRAGRLPAAEVEWRLALAETEKRLVQKPTDARDLLWKAVLLEMLGQSDKAVAALELHRQFSADRLSDDEVFGHLALMRAILAPPGEVMARAKLALSGQNLLKARPTAALVLFDPAFDPWRDHPDFPSLAAMAKGVFASLNSERSESK